MAYQEIVVNHKSYGPGYQVATFEYKTCTQDGISCYATLSDSLGPRSERPIGSGNGNEERKLIITKITTSGGGEWIAGEGESCTANFKETYTPRITIVSNGKKVSCFESTGTWPGTPV